MGMILRIASSRIVGQGDIVGRSGYFSLNLSANSVMRGRLDARRTLKSLVADLRVFFYLPFVSVPLDRFDSFLILRIRFFRLYESKMLAKRVNVAICFYLQHFQIANQIRDIRA